MKFFLPIISLLCASRSILGKGICYGQKYPIRVSYDDIININASCYPRDSCAEDRKDDSPGISSNYSCSCDRQCWEFGTCCIDSPHRDNAPPIRECRTGRETFSTSGYFMIHRCSDNMDIDSIWKSQCEKEWNGEDDILMLSPVTSLDTSTTYKNYYCFRCYETTENFKSWNLFLIGKSEHSEVRPDIENSDYSVAYNRDNKTWLATSIGGYFSIPVNLSFQVSHDIQNLPISCESNMISDCPDTWTDKYVLDKCKAYTSIVYSRSMVLLSYKNAHCALCNYESLENISCEKTGYGGFGGGFSFGHLIDINRSDGDKVGKIGKCDDNHLWDPYGKQCRKMTCALPGYVVENGRCIPP